MTDAPLVSLCIPTYRRAAFIGETLNSALRQTISDFEIIIVDDVSPDNTADVVAGFTDPRIRYCRNERNLGVPENLNHALSLARGEFMLILEDHDLLEPTYLEETLAVMQRHPTIGFAASGLVTINEHGQTIQRFVERWPELLPGRWLLRRLLTRTDCPFSVTTVIRRSAAAGLEPLFDTKYWWYADQYLWLRLAATSDFGYVAKPLLRFRQREAGHYLSERFWESMLCLDRIHRDNWPLLHAQKGVSAVLDGVKYETAKFKTVGGMRLGKLLRNETWTQTDRDNFRQYARLPSRLMLRLVTLIPSPIWEMVRSRYATFRSEQGAVQDKSS